MSDPPPRTAKLFWTGRSQAVRLPKEFRFVDSEVRIHRREDGAVVLEPIGGDRPVVALREAAAMSMQRLRDAIGAGYASGPAEAWSVEEVKQRVKAR